MRESTDIQSLPEQDPRPYGDVALGVECAWPQTLPVLERSLDLDPVSAVTRLQRR